MRRTLLALLLPLTITTTSCGSDYTPEQLERILAVLVQLQLGNLVIAEVLSKIAPAVRPQIAPGGREAVRESHGCLVFRIVFISLKYTPTRSPVTN